MSPEPKTEPTSARTRVYEEDVPLIITGRTRKPARAATAILTRSFDSAGNLIRQHRRIIKRLDQ